MMMRIDLLQVWALVALLGFGVVYGDEESHVYEDEESVILWFARIGPFSNPSESYSYYSLPFCVPEGNYHHKKKYGNLGEILEGNDLVQSAMTMNFKIDVPKTVLCEQTLSKEDATTFKYAISHHYWYQLYLDDLPIWGLVGEIVGTEEELKKLEEDTTHEHGIMDSYIFTSKVFSIGYNGNQIVEVNLTSEEPVDVEPGAKLAFSYSVKWVEVNKPFSERFNRYLDYSFFEHQIHWFSIFNSFMMVIFLCGLVSLILMKTLIKDYAKYHNSDMEIDGIDRDFGDDSGWKIIHGDVFRMPQHVLLYSAAYGTGMHILFLIFSVILLAIFGSLYVDRGALISAALGCYCVTSIIGGYCSGSVYQQYYHPKKAPNWTKCMLLNALLLPGACFIVTIFLNGISLFYNSINVVPFGAFMKIVMIFVVVVLPLNVAGTILGRNWNGQPNFPCRVNALPRQIPDHHWHSHPITIIFLTGLLPFGSIFIEVYFIFTSFWNYKFYYVYGFMLLVFIILIIVSLCVTVVATYFLLSSENWKWPWMSFLASGSTAFYVFLYSIYYFLVKTTMSGLLQTAYYFSYMLVFSLALGLMCGAIGTFGARLFVTRIYRNIKLD